MSLTFTLSMYLLFIFEAKKPNRTGAIYLFKVNNKDTKKKTLVDFAMVSLLLTLNRYLPKEMFIHLSND